MVVPFHPASWNFSYTADDLMEFFSGKDISTLLLVNPGNPSWLLPPEGRRAAPLPVDEGARHSPDRG